MNCLWRRINFPIKSTRLLKPVVIRTRSLVCNSENYVNTTSTSLLQSQSYFVNVLRHKSKKAQQDDSDDEELGDNDDTSLRKDSKVVKFGTTSLRADLILKSALGLARNKIEQQFYESRIRINGKKIIKKSTSVRIGDELDIVKMQSPKNPDHLYVSRVEIMNIVAKEESIDITARRFKNLLIENYEDDPFKGGSEAES